MPFAQVPFERFPHHVVPVPPFPVILILQDRGQEAIGDELVSDLSLPNRQANPGPHIQEEFLIHFQDTNHHDDEHGHIHALFRRG